jgi:hypothetical protein
VLVEMQPAYQFEFPQPIKQLSYNDIWEKPFALTKYIGVLT